MECDLEAAERLPASLDIDTKESIEMRALKGTLHMTDHQQDDMVRMRSGYCISSLLQLVP